jgi:hypothetical protein
MAEQNFSAALSTWKGKLRLLRRLNKLTTRDQPLGAAEVAGLDCPRAGRESKGEYGRKEEAGWADKGSVPASKVLHWADKVEFKKQPDDNEKFNSIKVLLKAYQGEIDSLTRRSKMSETSFLNLYKLLSDAPDPYPLLDAAVDQTVKVAEARMLESELARLREENGDLKRQVGEMSSVEDKRKKAEAKVESMEEKVSWRGLRFRLELIP